MTNKKQTCDPKYVLQNLEVIKKKTDKVDYLEDRLSMCGIPTKRKKRQMSGYNCFVKNQIRKTGEPFIKVVKARTWSTFSDKQKNTWNNSAKEGCVIR
ncbi:MAG: hypothetical protein V3V33_12520 [Candidatus Lokiarchaeia archaeon]